MKRGAQLLGLGFAAVLVVAARCSCERAADSPQVRAPTPCPPCQPCPPCAPSIRLRQPVGSHDSEGPAEAILYHLTETYQPVRFSHALHTALAPDCGACHHHHSELEPTPPCRECHGRQSGSLERPGLKGAYHRLCMQCHREAGSGPLECESCHDRRATAAGPAEREALARDAAPKIVLLGHLAKEHPAVRFDHEVHVDMADRCRDCHHHQGEVEQTPPCRECHSLHQTYDCQPVLREAYHQQCLACHRSMKGSEACSDCHPATPTSAPASVPAE